MTPEHKALVAELDEVGRNDSPWRLYSLCKRSKSAIESLSAQSAQPANPAQVTDALSDKYQHQDEIERIILRRVRENRVEGFTLEMAHEIAAIGAGGQAVAVKPLEWEETKGNYEGQAVWSPKNDIWPCWIVKNPDTDHYVWCEELGIELVPASPVEGTYPSLEEAKAAAQADYERRILSATVGGSNA